MTDFTKIYYTITTQNFISFFIQPLNLKIIIDINFFSGLLVHILQSHIIFSFDFSNIYS